MTHDIEAPAFPVTLAVLDEKLKKSLTDGDTEEELLQKQLHTLDQIFSFMLNGLGESNLPITSESAQKLMQIILKVQRQCTGTARSLTAMRYMEHFLSTT